MTISDSLKKHKQFFGISDDGQIEKGVGHVHPDLSEITQSEVFKKAYELNNEMAIRSTDREAIYKLWKVGHEYRNKVTNCIEVSPSEKLNIVPPNLSLNLTQKQHIESINSNLFHICLESLLPFFVVPALSYLLTNNLLIFVGMACVTLISSILLAKKRYAILKNKYLSMVTQNGNDTAYLLAISRSLLSALKRQNLISASVHPRHLTILKRSNGNARVILRSVNEKDIRLFLKSLKEILSALSNQKYIVPRYGFAVEREDDKERDFKLEEFFQTYKRGKATKKLLSYHSIPQILGKSEKGRTAFIEAWRKYVSPAEILEADKKPALVAKNFGIGPTVQDREIWD